MKCRAEAEGLGSMFGEPDKLLPKAEQISTLVALSCPLYTSPAKAGA